jgi:hypothetical protein
VRPRGSGCLDGPPFCVTIRHVDGYSWGEFESEAPELASFVRQRLDAHAHRVMATLRAAGSPRISGTELTIADGELWVGGLPGSRKFADLRRDPRLAIQSGSDDPPGFVGDARLSGRAVFAEDAATKARFLAAAGGGSPGPFELFRLRITEVSTVRVAESGDHLTLGVWRPGDPIRVIERY